jgi:transcriptional regulator with XRE-family HTH domain
MDPQKRKALETAGYRFTDAATFVGMTAEERNLLHARLELAKAVRRRREAQHLTQKQLAERIGSSQPRVAMLERAAPDVTFDLILKALAAVGVRLIVHTRGADPTAQAKKRPRPKDKRRTPPSPARPTPSEVELELIGNDP